MAQLIPMVLFALLLVVDPATCDTNFCSRGFFLEWNPNVLLGIATAWDYLGSYICRIIVFGSCRRNGWVGGWAEREGRREGGSEGGEGGR